MARQVPYTVLGGYLGAGKTTLLNHLLRHNDGTRLALLINDFGAINIDAALIESRTDDQINLTNGCICCGLSAGFDEAIDDLMTRNPPPERIVVEASGVADVVSLAQYGHHPGLILDGIIVVADAETVRAKARDKYVAATVTRQLRGADLLILNKVDLVDAARRGELVAWLNTLAPTTPVVTAERCQVSPALVLGHFEHDIEPADHRDHERYATWHFESAEPTTRGQVDAFLAALPDGVLRGKGFFLLADGKNLLYQQVGSRQTLGPTDSDALTQLVFIGLEDDLKPIELETIARAHLMRLE